MEKIFVNETELFVTPFDDYDIIIKKYCLEKYEKGMLIDSRFLPIYTGEEISYPLTSESKYIFFDLSENITEFRNKEKFTIKNYIDFYKNQIEHNYIF